MSEQETAARERALDRLLTFVDAVVAIAITLLVLPLVDIAADVGPGTSVGPLLREHRAQIGAFLLSFVVIANLWAGQHRAVRRVRLEHPQVTRLLLIWMLTIVVLPFPTSLVASPASDQALTKLVYVGTIAASTLLLALVQLVVRRNPQVAEGARPAVAPSLSAFVLLVVALVIMLVWPVTSYFPLLLLTLSSSLEALAHRLARRSHTS